MLLEFVTMKDPHLSFGFQNRIRKNYEKHISQKLEFVRGYALSNNIDTVVFTGDVFDSSTEDKWSFKKYRKNKRALEEFKGSELKLYSNVGNHDMFHGYEESEDTIFGEMVHDNILINLTKNPLVHMENTSVIKVQGVDYSNENNIVLENIRVFDEEAYPGYDVFKVCVLHSNVTPNEVKRVTDFTYKSLAEKFPDIDVFILGHYHVGYDTTTMKREGGKDITFINNWNFTRVVRDYEVELDEHSPEFEHVSIQFDNITKQFNLETKTIKVPFVTYNEAFSAKDIDILKKSKKEIFNFFEDINFEDIKVDSKKDDDTLITKIVEENEYTEGAMNCALEYLNNAQG
jgi:DNA repair exonuclease SbcCD nuclease subunit